MLIRRFLLLVLLAGCLPSTVASIPDTPLAEGDWVQVKGEFSGSVFRAHEIERSVETSPSIKGPIAQYDPRSGEFVYGVLRFTLDENTRIQATDGSDAERSLLGPGQRAKLSLRRNSDGTYLVRRVRLLEVSGSPRIRLQGQVEKLTHLENETYFTLLDVEVRADAKATWSKIARPRYTIDDEDVRPARGVLLGRFGRVSGEVRLDFKGEDNFDLTDVLDSDEATGRLRSRIEWIFPTTRHFSGMLQVKTEDEREIVDQADAVEDESKVMLGRAYLTLHNVLGRRGSVQVGRSRFDDKRDWLFNRDLDALRVFFDWSRWRIEVAAAEELVDPVLRHEDVFNVYSAVTYYPAKKHELTAYLHDRDDDYRMMSGDLRDFSPKHYGLRAEGDGKHWKYWADAAQARGRDRGVPLDAYAIDAGVTWIAPARIEPSITVAYAMGSGDDDPFDSVSHTFRQTGLHLNNGKFNGVSSFRYYGELMRPELANLHIETYGFGIRPKNKASIDLVYHRYKLDEPASELVDAAMDGRRLNLLDLDIGTEWDLVFGYEELRHWEFELDLAYFIPGDAFLGPTDAAASARFKTKYIF